MSTATPLWKIEHPRADVPDTIAKHPELHDVSWRNDVCPSFVKAADLSERNSIDEYTDGRVTRRLWVDYANAEDREYPEHQRFSVSDESGVFVYEGEDLRAALDAMGVRIISSEFFDEALGQGRR